MKSCKFFTREEILRFNIVFYFLFLCAHENIKIFLQLEILSVTHRINFTIRPLTDEDYYSKIPWKYISNNSIVYKLFDIGPRIENERFHMKVD